MPSLRVTGNVLRRLDCFHPLMDIPQIYLSWVTFAEGCTVFQLSTSERFPLPQYQQRRNVDAYISFKHTRQRARPSDRRFALVHYTGAHFLVFIVCICAAYWRNKDWLIDWLNSPACFVSYLRDIWFLNMYRCISGVSLIDYFIADFPASVSVKEVGNGVPFSDSRCISHGSAFCATFWCTHVICLLL